VANQQGRNGLLSKGSAYRQPVTLGKAITLLMGRKTIQGLKNPSDFTELSLLSFVFGGFGGKDNFYPIPQN
jgi:hypothetical protein